MTLGMFMTWAVVGGIAGCLVGYFKTDGGYGLIGDISLGIIGGLVGSGLFLFLGIWPDAGLFVSVVIAFLGATALIFAQHQFWAAHA